jgi:hypothetical protein
MAISEAFAGSEAVSTTEWSLPRDASYSAASFQTDDGVYQVFLDLSDMVTGDELQIRVYEKVQSTDTQRIAYEATLIGPQSPAIFVLPSLVLIHAWDVTLDQIAGTAGITVTWSIRKVA